MKYIKDEFNHTTDIMNTYHVHSLLAKVIENRGMDYQEYESLMNPRLVYHDFSLFSEAEMALDRIHEAIENNEKIVIYGDYDCDGILATTILVQALKQLGAEVGFYIPNRLTDGYGLNTRRVKQIAEKDVSLIITVDNGVKAFEAVDLGNELGIDVIITDHHTMDEDYPDACAIIHTHLSPDYPFKDICGGFIAYKLAAALLHKHDPYLYTLAAITTVSDMMPLLDENRSVVKRGIEFMKNNHYPQIDALLENQEIDFNTIGFKIAPKINAIGRLPEKMNPNILVKYFFKETSYDNILKISKLCQNVNLQRQDMTNQAYELSLQFKEDNYLYYGSSSLHLGIIGLVAGHYTRDYEKPAFIMHYDKQHKLYKGSARGIQGFSIQDFFVNHQDMFLEYGGHDKAGGFSISESNYKTLKNVLHESLKDKNFNEEMIVIPVDDRDLTINNIREYQSLEPFGQENKESYFILENKNYQIQTFSNDKHIKFSTLINGTNFEGLYFHQGENINKYINKNNSLIGTLSINTFRGKTSISMIIKDII